MVRRVLHREWFTAAPPRSPARRAALTRSQLPYLQPLFRRATYRQAHGISVRDLRAAPDLGLSRRPRGGSVRVVGDQEEALAAGPLGSDRGCGRDRRLRGRNRLRARLHEPAGPVCGEDGGRRALAVPGARHPDIDARGQLPAVRRVPLERGYSTEMVWPWASPLLYAGLACSLVCCALLLRNRYPRGAVTSRRTPPPPPPPRPPTSPR
jgi:hypothetical protein